MPTGNQLVPQGTLNRVRSTVIFSALQALNVIASNLAEESISMRFGAPSGILLPTLTGGVTSPAVYQPVSVQIHLLKSQSLAEAFKQQMQTLSNVGDVTVKGDANTLSDYNLTNCVLTGVTDITFDGRTVGYVIGLDGIYYVNSALWDLG